MKILALFRGFNYHHICLLMGNVLFFPGSEKNGRHIVSLKTFEYKEQRMRNAECCFLQKLSIQSVVLFSHTYSCLQAWSFTFGTSLLSLLSCWWCLSGVGTVVVCQSIWLQKLVRFKIHQFEWWILKWTNAKHFHMSMLRYPSSILVVSYFFVQCPICENIHRHHQI